MSTTLKTYDSIKEESLTDITSSKNIVSCCVKDLSFQVYNLLILLILILIFFCITSILIYWF